MERVNQILGHGLFLYHLEQNEMAEADRRFCRHNMEHFLDVARIGMILNLEEDFRIPKEWIYSAALLHDLGKHIQYTQGIPHELTGAQIAPQILQECGFDDKETAVITNAIREHRNPESAKERNLQGVLYRADKASRACFACKAEAACNWKGDKKNRFLIY